MENHVRHILSRITAAVLLTLTAQSASMAEVVGYNKINVPAGTDVRVSVPFNQEAVGTYTIATETASGVTVAPATFTANQFKDLYYVRFITGAGAGLWSTITANTAGELTLADIVKLAPHIAPGNTFRIYKHHTLRSFFPIGLLNVSYTNATTQVLIYENNLASMGQNKSPAKTAIHNAGNWLGAGVNNNTVLKPETQFIVRNNSASALTVYAYGDVPDYAVATLIAANGDLNIGTGYPLPVVLKNAGLSGASRQVLFYNNAATGINKSPVKTALSVGANWVGAGVTGSELLGASETITLRLPLSEAGTKVTIAKPY